MSAFVSFFLLLILHLRISVPAIKCYWTAFGVLLHLLTHVIYIVVIDAIISCSETKAHHL